MLHRRAVKPSHNTSGVIGVSRVTAALVASPMWIANWTDEDGKYRQRTFSTQRYGERKAKALAVAERQRQMERLAEMVKKGIALTMTTRRRARGEPKRKKKSLGGPRNR